MAKSNGEEIGKQKKKKKLFLKLAFFCVAVIFCVNAYVKHGKQNGPTRITGADFNSKVLGQESVPGESDAKKSEALSGSENFKATQLNVNGGISSADALVDFENSGLLEISNIKSELYSIKEGEKDEVKAIISFQTNKKTTLELKYSKSGEQSAQILKDAYFSLSHIVIVPALEPDSVYRYSVHARDPLGNSVDSDQFVFYTGAPNISLIDVLSNATQKVFGWAMRK